MSIDLGDIYEEVISDHVRHPHNYQGLESATRTTEGVSYPWSDEFTVHLELNHGRTNDSGFEGSRRAISHSCASRMTTMSVGRSEAEALALSGDVHATITERSDSEVGLAHLGRFAVRAGLSKSQCGSTTQRSHGTRLEPPSKSTTHGSPGSRHR
jgi:nitrogen fixation NifU-like protein